MPGSGLLASAGAAVAVPGTAASEVDAAAAPLRAPLMRSSTGAWLSDVAQPESTSNTEATTPMAATWTPRFTSITMHCFRHPASPDFRGTKFTDS